MALRKLEKFEKHWRERNWSHFSYSRKGCMSWANWFHRYRYKRRRKASHVQ